MMTAPRSEGNELASRADNSFSEEVYSFSRNDKLSYVDGTNTANDAKSNPMLVIVGVVEYHYEVDGKEL